MSGCGVVAPCHPTAEAPQVREWSWKTGNKDGRNGSGSGRLFQASALDSNIRVAVAMDGGPEEEETMIMLGKNCTSSSVSECSTGREM